MTINERDRLLMLLFLRHEKSSVRVLRWINWSYQEFSFQNSCGDLQGLSNIILFVALILLFPFIFHSNPCFFISSAVLTFQNLSQFSYSHISCFTNPFLMIYMSKLRFSVSSFLLFWFRCNRSIVGPDT